MHMYILPHHVIIKTKAWHEVYRKPVTASANSASQASPLKGHELTF